MDEQQERDWRDGWPLTAAAAEAGQPVLDDDDEDLRRGYSLLAELARADETLVELQPGVWRVARAKGDPSAR